MRLIPTTHPIDPSVSLTRRAVLLRALAFGGAIASSALLAACGGDDEDAPGGANSTPTSAGQTPAGSNATSTATSGAAGSPTTTVVASPTTPAEAAGDASPTRRATTAVASPTSQPLARPGVELPSLGEIVATISVGQTPFAIAAAVDGVWIGHDDGTVARIDPATNAVVATIQVTDPTPDAFLDMLIAFDAVWATMPQAQSLARIGIMSNVVAEIIEPDTEPVKLAAGAGSVWASAFFQSEVLRIDPATNAVVARVEVPSALAIAADDTAVWTSAGEAVARIDPLTNQVVATIGVSGKVRQVMVTDGAVWVMLGDADEQGNGLLDRIDPERDEVIATLAMPRGVGLWISASEDAVWIVTAEGAVRSGPPDPSTAMVWRLDPASNAFTAGLAVPGGGSVAASGQDIWVVNTPDNTVFRIAPAS